jgi:hypothetical protein
MLVAFGSHGEVRLFDARTGEPAGKLPGQVGRVTAVAFDPAGTRLAVTSGEPGQSGVVRVYRRGKDGRPDPAAVVALAAHKDAVYALAFAPDGKRLATAGYERVVRLFALPDSATGPVLPALSLTDHSDTVYGLAFSPDGKRLASCAADRAVKIWDADTGRRLFTLGEPTDWVYAVAWSPDGKHLTAAGVDKSLRVWAVDKAEPRLAQSVFAHDAPVWRLAYTADGKTLFTAGEDRVVKAWNTAKLAESKVYPPQSEAVLAFAVRPDGKQLAVGRFDGAAVLLDTSSGKPVAQPLPAKPVHSEPTRVTPAAATRGTTTRVVVTGKNLDMVKRVTAAAPGVTAKVVGGTPERLEVDVTIPATAAAGDLRLAFESEVGKTTFPFALDRYPVVNESGVTDSARASMAIKLPVTVVGTIDRAGDMDYFRFEATAGQQVGVQVVAAELGSKLDPVVVLTDAAGQVLAEGGTTLGYVIPAAGTYAVGIRDRDFRGGPDMTYRLHVGDVPVVTGVFPLAVRRGTATRVHVHGVNLGPAGAVAVTANPPADAAPGSKLALTVPPTASGESPLGTATAIVEEWPSAVVSPTGGADLRVPGSADGILAKPGDAQSIRFAAKKGQRLVVEVLARRAGSPVDPAIEVLDEAGKPVPRAVLRATSKTFTTFRDHDSASPGIRLESWPDLGVDDLLYVDGELLKIFALPRGPDDDCQFYKVDGQRVGFLDTTPRHHSNGSPMYRVEVHPPGKTFPPNGLPTFTLYYRNDDGGPGYGKDSCLFFDPPADGVYQVRVTDARGSSGPTHAYRVTVRPPKPNFAVSFNPTSPTVWKGGAVPVGVTATRADGFDGPIEVKLEGLPSGFHAPATAIEGNLTTTAFALYAEPGATVPPDAKLKLVARATVGGKEVTREVTGAAPRLADPGDIVATTRQAEVVIRPGEETRLVVDVERRNGFKGRIPVEVRGLPHGVRVLNVGLNGILITERDTSREVVLYAEPWVKPQAHPIVVLAKREGKGTEHAAKAVTLKVE